MRIDPLQTSPTFSTLMIKAVIFDLDGTLLDTLGDIAAAGNAVLRKRGLPEHEAEAYKRFIGDGMRNLARRIFPADHTPTDGPDLDEALADYKAEYARHWRDTTKPYDGIPELLDALVDRGIKLGIVSNKAHEFTGECVSEFVGGWPWSAVIGQRDGIPHKPDPTGALEAAREMGVAPEACAFVGDSGVDMQTGSGAGMKAVGVLWGFRGAEELRENGASALIETPSELLNEL